VTLGNGVGSPLGTGVAKSRTGVLAAMGPIVSPAASASAESGITCTAGGGGKAGALSRTGLAAGSLLASAFASSAGSLLASAVASSAARSRPTVLGGSLAGGSGGPPATCVALLSLTSARLETTAPGADFVLNSEAPFAPWAPFESVVVFAALSAGFSAMPGMRDEEPLAIGVGIGSARFSPVVRESVALDGAGFAVAVGFDVLVTAPVDLVVDGTAADGAIG
jgi:hypothetical protein